MEMTHRGSRACDFVLARDDKSRRCIRRSLMPLVSDIEVSRDLARRTSLI